jgi:hypothetical protein
MLLLNTKGRVTTANDKTNLIHKFDVPEGIKELKITYKYSPKTLEDREKAVTIVRNCFDKYDEELVGRPADYLPVKNLVTLSIDGCGAYRGAAHRQSNDQLLTISKDYATPGLIKGDICAGEWDIILNVHSVSCDVDYTIEIKGVEE